MSTGSANIREGDQPHAPARRPARIAAIELGRVGIAARAVLYLLMGIVAVLAAGNLHQASGPKGTLTALIAWPGGRLFVGLLAAGFAAFAVSHFLGVIVERDTHLAGWWRRIVSTFLAFLYTSFTFFSVNLALYRHGGSDQSTRRSVAYLFSWPGGRAALACLVVGLAIYGGYELWRACWEGPVRELPRAGWILQTLWRIGAAARGLIFLGVGVLLTRVVIMNHPAEAGGIGTTLRSLAGYPAAKPVLLAIGAGFMAFGVVEIIAAARGDGGPIVEESAHSAHTRS